jgi:hypothetical protein
MTQNSASQSGFCTYSTQYLIDNSVYKLGGILELLNVTSRGVDDVEPGETDKKKNAFNLPTFTTGAAV